VEEFTLENNYEYVFNKYVVAGEKVKQGNTLGNNTGMPSLVEKQSLGDEITESSVDALLTAMVNTGLVPAKTGTITIVGDHIFETASWLGKALKIVSTNKSIGVGTILRATNMRWNSDTQNNSIEFELQTPASRYPRLISKETQQQTGGELGGDTGAWGGGFNPPAISFPGMDDWGDFPTDPGGFPTDIPWTPPTVLPQNLILAPKAPLSPGSVGYFEQFRYVFNASSPHAYTTPKALTQTAAGIINNFTMFGTKIVSTELPKYPGALWAKLTQTPFEFNTASLKTYINAKITATPATIVIPVKGGVSTIGTKENVILSVSNLFIVNSYAYMQVIIKTTYLPDMMGTPASVSLRETRLESVMLAFAYDPATAQGVDLTAPIPVATPKVTGMGANSIVDLSGLETHTFQEFNTRKAFIANISPLHYHINPGGETSKILFPNAQILYPSYTIAVSTKLNSVPNFDAIISEAINVKELRQKLNWVTASQNDLNLLYKEGEIKSPFPRARFERITQYWSNSEAREIPVDDGLEGTNVWLHTAHLADDKKIVTTAYTQPGIKGVNNLTTRSKMWTDNIDFIDWTGKYFGNAYNYNLASKKWSKATKITSVAPNITTWVVPKTATAGRTTMLTPSNKQYISPLLATNNTTGETNGTFLTTNIPKWDEGKDVPGSGLIQKFYEYIINPASNYPYLHNWVESPWKQEFLQMNAAYGTKHEALDKENYYWTNSPRNAFNLDNELNQTTSPLKRSSLKMDRIFPNLNLGTSIDGTQIYGWGSNDGLIITNTRPQTDIIEEATLIWTHPEGKKITQILNLPTAFGFNTVIWLTDDANQLWAWKTSDFVYKEMGITTRPTAPTKTNVVAKKFKVFASSIMWVDENFDLWICNGAVPSSPGNPKTKIDLGANKASKIFTSQLYVTTDNKLVNHTTATTVAEDIVWLVEGESIYAKKVAGKITFIKHNPNILQSSVDDLNAIKRIGEEFEKFDESQVQTNGGSNIPIRIVVKTNQGRWVTGDINIYAMKAKSLGGIDEQEGL
jgi:hypothetical protein